MKHGTPKEIAQHIAIATTLTAGIISIPAFLLFEVDALYALYVPAALIVFYFAVCVVAKQIVEQYIQRRIKLIYKTIHHIKSKPDDEEDEPDFSPDAIARTEKEVEQWAMDNREEINRLREQEKFRKEFIGNLSHELKTPIFTIQGYLLTLLEGGLEDEQINRKYLEKADKNLDRLTGLINELEEITKLESGTQNMKHEVFDFTELTKEVLGELEYKAKENNIKLDFRDKNTTFKVEGDRLKIAQVLTNLVVNSIKYGKRDESGKTTIKCYDMDDHILVEVEDNGLGIASEHLPRLFERFYRVDKSRARHIAGSGLGLAIVKHIIESHGQTINVRSREGEGSTFSFTLKKAA